ncbi:MAG TPA: hypothetical protein VK539_26565 [Myxococcaceae bacterium]|nr:hypothetical protein [Myxococcaceae bacterium]
MSAFRIKEFKTALFGDVETDAEGFWSLFSAGPYSEGTLRLGKPALKLIAEKLGITADWLAQDLHAYVAGRYRQDSIGPGSRLGEFGEIIAYLQLLKAGLDPIRVIGWRPAPGQRIKANRFPQPDYLIFEKGRTGCAEVKSTEALDFQYLASSRGRRQLKPCQGVRDCRWEALQQLAYNRAGQRVRMPHSLRLKTGADCPFPVSYAVAIAMLFRDGRLSQLESEQNLVTPRHCATKGRTCWQCLRTSDGEPADLVSVHMHNEPGRLSLPGDASREWFDAYARWCQAVWARDLFASRAATAELARLTSAWIGSSATGISREVLLDFWHHYLVDALWDHGLGTVEVRGGWFPSGPAQARQDQPRETLIRPGGMNEAEQLFLSRRPGGVSVNALDDLEMTFSLVLDEVGWCIRACSIDWWDRESVQSDEHATQIADQMSELADGLAGVGFLRTGVETLRVEAVGEDRSFLLGWERKMVVSPRGDPREDLKFLDTEQQSGWLFVYPNGCALLRCYW